MIDLIINTCSDVYFSNSSKCLKMIGNYPVLCHVLDNLKNITLIKDIYVLVQEKEKVELEMKRWLKEFDKKIFFIRLNTSIVYPVYIAEMMQRDCLFLDLTFPFLSFQVFDWFFKTMDESKINVLIGNFKDEKFIHKNKLHPCDEQMKDFILLKRKNENNIIPHRYMNISYIPFEIKNNLQKVMNQKITDFLLSQNNLKILLLPSYYMNFEATPFILPDDEAYLNNLYEKHNHTNNSMEFFYLWKQMEKLEKEFATKIAKKTEKS